MIKALQSYGQNELESITKRANIVRIENKNSEEYTVTKKSTATISNNFTALHNAFNKILANVTNIKALQEVDAANKTTNISYVPVATKVVGTEEFVNKINVVGKYFERLTELLKKLDMSPDEQPQQEQGQEDIDVDVDRRRRRGRGRGRGRGANRTRSRRMGGRGLFGKALGIFGAGLDLTDRLSSGEDITEAGVGVAGGVAGGWAGAEAGAALGALGGPAAPITVPLGGLIGGALGYFGGSYLADKAYDLNKTQSPAEKQLISATAKVAAVPATREPSEISNNSYSSRFAQYLQDTFENVSSYVSGIVGSVFGGGASWPVGPGAGATENAQIAMDFFTSPQGGGWSREQAAGIVANLQAESGPNLDPNAFNPKGGNLGAYGLAQWRGPRQTKFQEVYGKSIRGSSLTEQLSYVNWELNNVESDAGNRLRSARTAEEATNVIYRYYERAGAHDSTAGKRLANAQALLESSALTGGQFVNPLPGARLSSGFGPRKAPTAGASTDHKGLDFAAPNGTPIRAAGAGRVTFVGSKRGWGNTIEISHGGGLLTRYAHLSSFMVSQGMDVQAGQNIGAVGNTGTSTGNHLHFEVVRGGVQVDPRPFLSGAQTQASPQANPVPFATPDYLRAVPPRRPRRGDGSLLMINGTNPFAAYQPSFAPKSAPSSGPQSTNPNSRNLFMAYHGY